MLPFSYNPWLILVSVLISMVAAYAAFALAERMRASAGSQGRPLWWLGGSLAMGLGIWAMHYLGMLAVQLPIPVMYEVPTVLLSLLLAVAAAAVALQVVSSPQPTWTRLILGGAAMGAGIGGMHYVGMRAMRMQAMHHYDERMVALSLVLAVGLSILALWLATTVRELNRFGASERVSAGAVMGLAIASMHYTAMAGVTYTACRMSYGSEWTVQISSLDKLAIALVVGLVLMAALGSATLHQRQFAVMQAMQQQLLQQQSELLESQSKLLKVNTRLAELSIRDALTGLHNRRHFDEMFDIEWRRASRDGSALALLVIDVDHFKALNDSYGHQAGDESLKRVAKVLKSRTGRPHDVLARYGGEEFAILLPGVGELPAGRIAEAVRKSVEQEAIEHGASPMADVITVSIGVCSRVPQVGDSAAQMLQDADTALYAAKENGRNRVVLAAAKRESYTIEGAADELMITKVYEHKDKAYQHKDQRAQA